MNFRLQQLDSRHLELAEALENDLLWHSKLTVQI